jgi:hypothetical protein
LARAAADKAKGIVIMANRLALDPAQEDTTNMMTLLAVAHHIQHCKLKRRNPSRLNCMDKVLCRSCVPVIS